MLRLVLSVSNEGTGKFRLTLILIYRYFMLIDTNLGDTWYRIVARRIINITNGSFARKSTRWNTVLIRSYGSFVCYPMLVYLCWDAAIVSQMFLIDESWNRASEMNRTVVQCVARCWNLKWKSSSIYSSNASRQHLSVLNEFPKYIICQHVALVSFRFYFF